MAKKIATKAESLLLALGKVMARATSDFAEAESLIRDHGKTGNRKVSEKKGISSSRSVDVGILAEKGWSKDDVKEAAAAARILNAFDVLASESGVSPEELEAVRLEIMASLKEDVPAPAPAK